MADALVLHEITASCRLGVYEWEQRTPQDVWVDLELAIDASAAAATDDVTDAVDYAALVKAVIEEVRRRPYRLLETLAERIAARVLDVSGMPRVRVRVKKKAMPKIGYAAVEIERARRPGRRYLAPPSERPPSGWPRSTGREGDRPRSRRGSVSPSVRRRGRMVAGR